MYAIIAETDAVGRLDAGRRSAGAVRHCLEEVDVIIESPHKEQTVIRPVLGPVLPRTGRWSVFAWFGNFTFAPPGDEAVNSRPYALPVRILRTAPVPGIHQIIGLAVRGFDSVTEITASVFLPFHGSIIVKDKGVESVIAEPLRLVHV